MNTDAARTLFGEEPVLRIVITPPIVSGNEKHGRKVVTKIVNGKPRNIPVTYTTHAGKAFDARVKELAAPCIWRAQWKIPEYVRMDVTLCNINMDRDNVNKTVADALQGVAFHFDSRILDGQLKKIKDKNGPRVEVVIRPVDGRDYGY